MYNLSWIRESWKKIIPGDRDISPVALKMSLCLFLVVLFVVGVYLPFSHERKLLLSEIKTHEHLLVRLSSLEQTLQRLKGMVGNQAGGEENLFVYAEKVISREGLRDKLVSIVPSSRTLDNNVVQSIAELRFKRLYLSELVRLLYALNSNPRVRIEEFNLINYPDKNGNLDIKLIISYTKKVTSSHE